MNLHTKEPVEMTVTQRVRREVVSWRLRIFSTIASGLAVALLVWAGTALLQLPVIAVKLEDISIQLSGVRTEKDAKRDIGALIDRLQHNEDIDIAQTTRLNLEDLKLEAHEQRLHALEIVNSNDAAKAKAKARVKAAADSEADTP